MPRPCTCGECHLCWLFDNDERYRSAWGDGLADEFEIVPAPNRPCTGSSSPRPWKYRVAAAIPHYESLDTLEPLVELLRLQSMRPYIMVIDTGSNDSTCDELEKRRAHDLEIHYVRSHGWLHPSEPVSAAMDLAFGVCRSEWMFCTHSDVFPRRRDLIERLLRIGTGDPLAPAVGYEMSDRSHVTDQWRGMISHTASLLHMPTMRRIGASWSIQRACEMLNIPPKSAGWPDTETCLNLMLRQYGIAPTLIGTEVNDQRHVDENIDHVRSLSSVRIYADDIENKKRAGWLAPALEEARVRIAQWREHGATVLAH